LSFALAYGSDTIKPVGGSPLPLSQMTDLVGEDESPANRGYDANAYAAMRSWRAPIVTVHAYGFYALLGLGSLHIFGVVVTEVRERTNLVSAMFTGEKTLSAPPADQNKSH
jgi:cytochrome b